MIPDGGPLVQVVAFSAEAAIRLLAIFGVQHIRTIGIDGGDSYSKYFDYLKPLTNGQKSFDRQFVEIAKIQQMYNLDLDRWSP